MHAEIVIRHVAVDGDRAAALAQALRAFGYIVETSLTPAPEHAGPQIFLWSPDAVNDEALIWEAAECVREGRNGVDRVHTAVVRPVATAIKLRHAFIGGDTKKLNAACDLTTWDGSPDNDALASLLWELPPPDAPAARPPRLPPADRNEAAWLAVVLSGDPVRLAQHIYWMLSALNGRHDREPPSDKIAHIQALGRDPERWARHGPTLHAAAKQGPAALHALGVQVRDGELPADCPTTDKLAVLLAIQITVGNDFEPVSYQDHRTHAELLAALERGDGKAWHSLRHIPHDKLKALMPTVEKVAAQGIAAAQCALGQDWSRPAHEQRLWLEKAAAQNYPEAFYYLALQFQRDQWRRKKAIEYWRKGAELGEMGCIRHFAEALDQGKGVKRDPAEAYRLYGKLHAAYGECSASERMAQMLWDGDGVARDRAAAIRLFFHSHIVDHSGFADIFLGDMYRDGLGGLPRDRDEAIGWYQTALHASNDVLHLLARERLKKLGVKPEKDEDESDMDPEDLKALRDEARAVWAPRA